MDFSEYSSYEIADVIKLYFRELPEPLLTTKLSEALLSSYECKLKCIIVQICIYMITLVMERKKERRKKERQTPEANEKTKMSCLRWDLKPRHSALRTDVLTNCTCSNVWQLSNYIIMMNY